VPHAAVAADLHQALDVLADLLAEIALHPPLVLDDLADPLGLDLGEVADLGDVGHLGLGQDVARARTADAVDVGETDPDLLVLRQVDSCDACHSDSLSLTLLVFRVLADHPHDALATDDLALRADPLHRRTYFHGNFFLSPPST